MTCTFKWPSWNHSEFTPEQLCNIPGYFTSSFIIRSFKRKAPAEAKAFRDGSDVPKLAAIGKPKSNWELRGVLGLAAFFLGFLAGK